MNATARLISSHPNSGLDSVAKIFHRLNRVLPEDQVIVKISPSDAVSEALRLMRKGHFSQLPVVEGNEVLGVFSYRSLAEGLLRLKKPKPDMGNLPVEEFIEKSQFARITDEFITVFENLEKDNVVLIGEPDRLQGIVTAMDVLRYLYGVASPFVLVGEIELAIRALISLSVDDNLLASCARVSLSSKYEDDRIPTALTDMEFNDYIQLVGHGDNWKFFAPIFGGMRETIRTKLEEIRDLRNAVFHFKRDLSWEDHENLVQLRDWVLMKAKKVDARLKEGKV